MDGFREITWDEVNSHYTKEIVDEIRDAMNKNTITDYYIDISSDVMPEIINIPYKTEVEIREDKQRIKIIDKELDDKIHDIMKMSGKYTEEQLVDNCLFLYQHTTSNIKTYTVGYCRVVDDIPYIEAV